MNISIIICTYNRSAMLRDTMESFLMMQRPIDVRCDVIIVDNNSDDDTATVGKEFCDRQPELFRYVKERTQGLSFARNCGIRSSEADLIAFVDDDIYFDRSWLVEMLRLFRESTAMCAGGRSIPQFECGAPSWMSAGLFTLYGSTNSGDTVKRMIFPEHPFGLNMVFRREVFKIVGLFNVTLGRVKNSLLSNEEAELFFRIDRAGLPVFYAPLSIIHHRIPAARTRKAWALRRYYYQGISDMASSQLARHFSRTDLLRELAGKVFWLLGLVLSAARARAMGGADESRAFQQVASMCYAAGMAAGCLRQALCSSNVARDSG